MKRWIALPLAAAMLVSLLAGCGPQQAETSASVEEVPVVGTLSHLRVLLPEHGNREDIRAHAAGFGTAVKDALRQQGWEVGKVTVQAAGTDEALGKALDDGSAEVVVMPASQYFTYEDTADLLMTATVPGVSADSMEPADWNGSMNAPRYTDRECPYSRTLICTTLSPKGQALRDKAKAGTLTFEDLAEAQWLMPKTTDSSDFLYPQLYLKAAFGKTLEDLHHLMTIDGYGALFHDAATGMADIIVISADRRIDYADAWHLSTEKLDHTGKLGIGQEDSIFNQLSVIGVTEPIYGDVMVLRTGEAPLDDEHFQQALSSALDSVKNQPDVRAIYESCGYTGFTPSSDGQYENIRSEIVYGAGD